MLLNVLAAIGIALSFQRYWKALVTSTVYLTFTGIVAIVMFLQQGAPSNHPAVLASPAIPNDTAAVFVFYALLNGIIELPLMSVIWVVRRLTKRKLRDETAD